MSHDLEELKKSGFLVRDNVLPEETFSVHRRAAMESWESKQGWKTLVRDQRGSKVTPFLADNLLTAMINLLSAQKENESDFFFAFHRLLEEDDEQEIVASALADLTTAWGDIIPALAPTSEKREMSLTAYTEGCFLDKHTDENQHISGKDHKKVTLLWYFTSGAAGTGDLVFSYNGQQQSVEARPNRSVLFVPTSETIHWVETVRQDGFPRLALSGWLL